MNNLMVEFRAKGFVIPSQYSLNLQRLLMKIRKGLQTPSCNESKQELSPRIYCGVHKKIVKYLTIFLTSFLIFSCSEKNLSYDYPEDPSYVRKSRAGKFFGKNNSDIIIYGGKEKSEKSQEKSAAQNEKEPEKTIIYKKSTNQLWNASIETISEILPISIIDSGAKLISTDWYQNDSLDQNKRIKINLVIKGTEIKEENIILSLFRQRKNQNGEWQDEKVSDETVKKLKEKIINRANQI